MSEYVTKLELVYSENSNIEYAIQMKKYLKNKFEFFGLKGPLRRNLQKEFLKSTNLPSYNLLEEIVLELWEKPEREFQHFALDLMQKFSNNYNIGFIETIEKCILKKSWWDTVDYLSANIAGNYFIQFPKLIPDKSNKWMDSGNIWLQRSALLFQLKYKNNTNFSLLQSYILRLNESKEFFIRKAIGWILREYSKTHPEIVINFVNETSLSGLSRREALRIIEKHKH